MHYYTVFDGLTIVLSCSVVMTTGSVICAFGMMPLNLFIYSRSWTDDDSVIPYTKIVLTLLSILVPVAFGIIIHYKLSKLDPYIAKVKKTLKIISPICTKQVRPRLKLRLGLSGRFLHLPTI